MTLFEENPFQQENEIVRRFQVVEELAHRVDTPEAREEIVREAIFALELDQLQGKQLMADAALVFARKPNAPPKSRLMFPHGFLFIAQLVNYGELVDEKIPVDARTAHFVYPQVVGLDPKEERAYRALRFEVPFLAVTSAVLAEAA